MWTLAVAAWAGPALAHDFWIQPRSFRPAQGVPAPTTFFVGHGPDRDVWGADPRRLIVMRSLGPAGAVDRQGEARAVRSLSEVPFRYAGAGAHMLVLRSNHAESVLPAIRFNDYVKEEGLTPIQRRRTQARKLGEAGREIYSRQAKAIVQVGPVSTADQPWITEPAGLVLEIVPERNPYTRTDDRMPFRIYYEGKPLAGALVKLTNLASDAKPVAMARSDAQGRVVFQTPRSGAWLVNVLWSRPISGHPRAEFDTTFSSLTFGYQ